MCACPTLLVDWPLQCDDNGVLYVWTLFYSSIITLVGQLEHHFLRHHVFLLCFGMVIIIFCSYTGIKCPIAVLDAVLCEWEGIEPLGTPWFPCLSELCAQCLVWSVVIIDLLLTLKCVGCRARDRRGQGQGVVGPHIQQSIFVLLLHTWGKRYREALPSSTCCDTCLIQKYARLFCLLRRLVYIYLLSFCYVSVMLCKIGFHS